MRKLRYFIEFLPVALLDAIFSAVPRSAALRMGEGVGALMSGLLKSRTRLIMENLRHAFPDMPDAERARITARVWRNIGRNAAEFIRMPEINEKNMDRYFLFEGLHHAREALQQGRGLILLSPHFGNWEAVGYGSPLGLKNVTAIARPIKNPFVDDWVRRKRMASGLRVILHRQAVKAGLRTLKEGHTFGILPDQNLYTGGVFVNFFGRPAASTTLPALLHDRTGAPVILSYCLREGPRFRLVYGAPLEFPPVEDVERRMIIHTQVVSDAIEAVIRRHPDQWFWIHNRWKRSAEAAAGALS